MSRENGTIILWRKLDRLDNSDESGMGEKKLNSLIKVSREEYEKYAGNAGYFQTQGFYVYRNHRLIIKST